MSRKSVSQTTQTEVVTRSRRRCALCVFLENNLSERPGQIAHVNGDHSDSSFENLVWLCLEHHDKFDSKTSQTKNYTQLEVKAYRDRLYQSQSSNNNVDVQVVRNYLNRYARMFSHLFHERGDLAFKIDHNVMDDLEEIQLSWQTSSLRSYDSSIRGMQDQIADNLSRIFSIYETQMYDLAGGWIKFNTRDFHHDILVRKRGEVKGFVDAVEDLHHRLQQAAVV